MKFILPFNNTNNARGGVNLNKYLFESLNISYSFILCCFWAEEQLTKEIRPLVLYLHTFTNQQGSETFL